MQTFRTVRRFCVLVAALLPLNLALAPQNYPRDWGGGGKGYELTLDSATKHGGRSSGSIRATDAGGIFGTFTQWFRADPYRGKRLRLTGHIKTEGADGEGDRGGAGLWMRVDGASKTCLAFDNMGGRRPHGTTDWKLSNVVLDIPNEAEELYFGCLLAGSGRAWVDDLKFEVVGPEVATTQLEVSPSDRGANQPLIKDMRKAPSNLDFEQ